jgi:hypothetical protein
MSGRDTRPHSVFPVTIMLQRTGVTIKLRLRGKAVRRAGQPARRRPRPGTGFALPASVGDRKGSIWGLRGRGCPGSGMAESAPCPLIAAGFCEPGGRVTPSSRRVREPRRSPRCSAPSRNRRRQVPAAVSMTGWRSSLRQDCRFSPMPAGRPGRVGAQSWMPSPHTGTAWLPETESWNSHCWPTTCRR